MFAGLHTFHNCVDKNEDWNESLFTIPDHLAGWLDKMVAGQDAKEHIQIRIYHSDTGVFSSLPEGGIQNHDMQQGLITVGKFIGNVPNGLVWQWRGRRHIDGFLYGRVNGKGKFTGRDIIFIYPDLLTGLRGRFVDGILEEGNAVNIVGERCNNGLKEIKTRLSKEDRKIVWAKHETNASYIGLHPTVVDPHEKRALYVGQSGITTATEGLFAKKIFSPGNLISYYSGQKTYISNIIHKHNMTNDQIVSAASYNFAIGQSAPSSWGYPADLIIDVGSKYRNTTMYQTTLGHKANHKFGDTNVIFDTVDHPIMGGIACLVATKEIDEHEEIFVDYNYDLDSPVPDWYADALDMFVIVDTLQEIYPD